MTITILLADNLEDFVKLRSEFLEDAGYRVIKAYNPEAAARAMDENHIQLALLDIRLRNDDDGNDISGIILAKNPAYSFIPKIILTNFPDYTTVSEIFNKMPGGLPPFVNYLKKRDGLDAMLDAIEKAIDEYIHLNENLLILWDEEGRLSFPGLVGKIESGLPPEHLSNRVQEMQALFQKLFCSSEQITIAQQLWMRTGRVGLEVRSFANGKEDLFFVTAGLRAAMAKERESLNKHALQVQQGGKLSFFGQKEESHYAIAAWSILANGQGVEDLTNFAGYYMTHTEKQTRPVLEGILQNTYLGWEKQGRSRDKRRLDLIYRSLFKLETELLPSDTFSERMEALAHECVQRGLPDAVLDVDSLQITFHNGHDLSTANPIPYLTGQKALPSVQAMVGLSLGGLEPDSILVDRLGQTWLSDFGSLVNAPVWLDAASLEYQIRSKLMDTKDLQELYEMEKCFLGAHRLGEAVPTDEVGVDYRKPAACIQTIRQKAAEYIGDELTPYELSLLFLIGRDLSAYNSSQRKKSSEAEGLLYRLLLAGMICEKLAGLKEERPSHSVSPFAKGLYIDEDNHETWVGDRLVNLTQREYELLLYLYKHPGALCKREEILRDVFQVTSPGSDDENLLNTNISRLRRKIQVDPDDPGYLQTVRGIGFKLMLKPE